MTQLSLNAPRVNVMTGKGGCGEIFGARSEGEATDESFGRIKADAVAEQSDEEFGSRDDTQPCIVSRGRDIDECDEEAAQCRKRDSEFNFDRLGKRLDEKCVVEGVADGAGRDRAPAPPPPARRA